MESPEDNTVPGSAAEEIRYRTLTELEKLLRLLVDRHGARMTLGEMLAITAAMARLRSSAISRRKSDMKGGRLSA